MTRLIALFLFLLSSATLRGGIDRPLEPINTADAEACYLQARDELAAGQPERAAQLLEGKLGRWLAAPEAYLLLGNAQAAQGKPAAAMASYRRALLLDPGLAEARQNLTFLARQQGVAEAPPPGPFATFLGRLRARWLLLIAVGCGWLGLAGLLVRQFRIWFPLLGAKPWVLPASIALLATSLAGGATLWAREKVLPPVSDLRVVMTDDKLLPVPARRAADSPVVEKVKAGTVARLLDDHDAWAYVEVPSGNGQTTIRGWLRGQSLDPLCDFDPRLLKR